MKSLLVTLHSRASGHELLKCTGYCGGIRRALVVCTAALLTAMASSVSRGAAKFRDAARKFGKAHAREERHYALRVGHDVLEDGVDRAILAGLGRGLTGRHTRTGWHCAGLRRYGGCPLASTLCAGK